MKLLKRLRRFIKQHHKIYYHIVYDNEDNIIKINCGDWVQNIDIDTQEIANNFVGVFIDWENEKVILKFKGKKRLSCIKINNSPKTWHFQNNKYIIDFAHLQNALNYTDILHIDFILY